MGRGPFPGPPNPQRHPGVWWGGGGCQGFPSSRRPQGGSSPNGETEAARGGDAPASEFNFWFPVNLSWVVSSPRSRCEGEAAPWRQPGTWLPRHRSTPSGPAMETCPLLSERPPQARRAPRQRFHALVHPPEKAPGNRAPSPRPPVRRGGRAQPEPRAAGPRPGGHGDGGGRGWRSARTGVTGEARAAGTAAGAPRERRDPRPQGPGRREGRAPVAHRTAPPPGAAALPRVRWGRGPPGHAAPTRAPTHPRRGPATQPSLPRTRRAGWCAAAGPG